MGDLRKNFSSEEFACKCGCGLKFQVDEALLDLLQYARDELDAGLEILSGCRCRAHNSNTVGAAENSYHIPRESLMGLPILYAADVSYADKAKRTPVGILKLYCYLSQGKAKGLGLYSNRCHADTRLGRRNARWISAMPQ
jgi:hypothetical protein|tara:strand:- start:22 stop:441 length:420 start_codon:yes stop_codon:yes gene_type:complete